jgi:protease-4
MSRRRNQIILVLFLLFFLVVIPVTVLFTWISKGHQFAAGKKTAVVIEVRGNMHEYSPQFAPGMIFGRRDLTQTDILSGIRLAADDKRVEAIVLKILPSAAGIAKCEEIGDALQGFKERGKRVVSFSPVLVNNHYLLACAADSLFMPPSGYLMLTGPASSAVFVRGLFDKLGIVPNVHRIEDYKSAAEFYTETERTPESKEMIGWILGDVFERFAATIARERGQERTVVEMMIDRGLFSPARALDAGLIDGVRYWDQVAGSFEDDDIELVSLDEYLKTASPQYVLGGGPRIAVIHAQGVIVMGKSGFDMSAGPTMGSETMIRQLRTARNDARIKAVVFRIDSPGGDGLAGEMISREVEITSTLKPVVVSMSDVAASGGYEIAYRADRIVALPGSITGSIGSITGKLNMRGFYNKIGITKDETGIGEKALIYSDYRDFTDAEWEVIKEEHWAFYTNWIREIARFRGMGFDEVDSLARGRVWTGEQAVNNGLIDYVGGFDRAVAVACELAGIPDPSRVELVHMPTKLSVLQSILSGGFFDDAAAYLLYGIVDRHVAGRRGIFLRHGLSEEWSVE